MAEGIEKEDRESQPDEDIEGLDSDDEIDEPDAGKEEKESSAKKKIPGNWAGIFSRHKWILLTILGPILIISALGLKYSPKWLGNSEDEPQVILANHIDEDNLMEEVLSPFFIPIPHSSSKEVVRIDLTIVWDNLASLRYKKKELRIRDHLYQYITNRSKENEDLNTMVSFMEAEMSRTFRESLRVKNLMIKVKEIKYF